MPDAQGLHRCPICFKGYKRREHLQRHRSSHNAERPHRCILCDASFQRTDVLKRHLQTCDRSSSSSSGRRRACDRCVRQKKACNSLQPCQNCERRAVQCLYSNASTSSSPNPVSSTAIFPPPSHQPPTASTSRSTLSFPFEAPPLSGLNVGIHNAVSQFPAQDGHTIFSEQPEPGDWFGIEFTNNAGGPATQSQSDARSSASESRGYSFDFLYDFTSRSGLVSSFECATLEQRQQIVSKFDNAYLEQHQDEPLVQVPVPPAATSALDPSQPLGYPDTNTAVTQGLIPWSYSLQNPLIIKLHKIVTLVKSVVIDKPKNSTVTLTWSPELEQQCLHFFSPYRFNKFLELYWSVWHPNVSIIHRPTFDPTVSKSILLAAMALIGACVSPDPQDNEDARVWFNCVEEMVFTDDDFCSDVEPADEDRIMLPNAVANWGKLQALQASYVVCLYQNWEGTDPSKRRIRRHRFSTVVSVARDIGIDTARHLDYSSYIGPLKHEFPWSEYVFREQLIRTFLWIFLLDTAFVIFNNLPHRMVIKEMKMHMASPAACFQAVSAEECAQKISELMPPSSVFCTLLLRDAIEKVCMDNLTMDEHQRFSRLGPLNLFVIVSAFHSMIFQHQNSFGGEGQLIPIRNGLHNWIAIWEWWFDSWSSSFPFGTGEEASLLPETMWKRVGFIRFSPEYWLLGTLLVDRISETTSKPGEQPLSRLNSTQRSSGEGMGTSGRVQARSVEPILDKYDQTSMRQVNDLITGFQKLNVD